MGSKRVSVRSEISRSSHQLNLCGISAGYLLMSIFWSTATCLSNDLGTQVGPDPLSPTTCPISTVASPFESVPADYQRKYNTIAHRMLDSESPLGNVTPLMYSILDTLLDEAKSVLKPYLTSLSVDEESTFAIEAFKHIDCILLRHGFVYPHRGLVQLLSDGLSQNTYLASDDLNRLQNHPHNLRREHFMSGRGVGPYHVVDCDIASFIYLAVAEEMKYPVFLVEMPTHNFVRWEMKDGTYINFETMDGMETNDAYYLEKWNIPSEFVGKGGILVSMKGASAISYHGNLVAVAWSWKGDYPKMIESYLKALAGDPTRPFAYNNLAWYYAAVPIVNLREGSKSLQYAKEATRLLPNGDHLDTLACAYAQLGDFASAIEVAKRAVLITYVPFGSNILGDLALFTAQPPKACTDLNFGKDLFPFRPGEPLHNLPTEKELFRLH